MLTLAAKSTLILVLSGFAAAQGQQPMQSAVHVTVVDETGAAVPQALVTVEIPGTTKLSVSTDFAGHARLQVTELASYRLQVQKPGFYQVDEEKSGPADRELRVVITHEQMVVQQVDVKASPRGIDPQQASDNMAMDVPEIINVPYPTSRDIRNLLNFFPGVVQDSTGQVHVAGSETWATLDLLDGFDVRSPISGRLAMRFSADAVRSVDEEATRYSVQYGRSTGGVVAFRTGMGDNQFRFNATNFVPGFRDVNGIRFDKFVPRVTFSGPLRRDRAWFFDGFELEINQSYVPQLPEGQNSNHLQRGSNLLRTQWNATPADIVNLGWLLNGLRSPYDGLSFITPRQSTTKRDTNAWLPYVREQHSFARGALLDLGAGIAHFHDGYQPHTGSAYALTPEQSRGAYFEDMNSRSQRFEANATLYLPVQHWRGTHILNMGADFDRIAFFESVRRAPVSYLREDGTLLRKSTFPAFSSFTRHNLETGFYVQDRWQPHDRILLESGIRADWDEIIRTPLWSPRLALTWTPGASAGSSKLSAGVGTYYEHTQLEYLARAVGGTRFDTYYAADGVTPLGRALKSTFTVDQSRLREAHALNWSIGWEQKIWLDAYVKANFIHKRVTNLFTYANQTAPGALFGTYLLTNGREDHDTLAEVEARKTFKGSYSLFAAYTWSRARTNSAIDYQPTISYLGAQQAGPLPWDTPHRVISWGWLPFAVPLFRKHWDFVYAFEWRTGFPFTAVNANREVVGAANGLRFPEYMSFDPGLEFKFHFRGTYFGLRGVLENATGALDPSLVNNVTDSPQYGAFSFPSGRALTARIRIIDSKR